jgi:hypothetical protein
MLAGATSGIEHASDEISLPGEAFEGWLGTPDIPSGWSLRHIDGIEVVTRALHANHAARDRAALLTAQDGRLDSVSAPVRIERLGATAPPSDRAAAQRCEGSDDSARRRICFESSLPPRLP